MKIWFDTEFVEDGKTIDLISIGAVREDGERFYAENAECDHSRADPWVVENVLSKLKGGEVRGSRLSIATAFEAFAGQAPEFWAYYASYDWVVLCQLYGRMIDLPSGWPMYVRDLKQEIDRLGCGKPPEQAAGEHNALDDALWTRDAWLWLQRLPTTPVAPNLAQGD